MKALDTRHPAGHTDVRQARPRHGSPRADDVMPAVAAGPGRLVLLTRPADLPRCLCQATRAPGDRWLFECGQPPGHLGLHAGLAVRWPAGQVRERLYWP